jgi:hypothetical protein
MGSKSSTRVLQLAVSAKGYRVENKKTLNENCLRNGVLTHLRKDIFYYIAALHHLRPGLVLGGLLNGFCNR